MASCVNVTLIGNARVRGMILGSETSTVQRTLPAVVLDGDTDEGDEEKELNMLLLLRGGGPCCAADGRLALLPEEGGSVALYTPRNQRCCLRLSLSFDTALNTGTPNKASKSDTQALLLVNSWPRAKDLQE